MKASASATLSQYGAKDTILKPGKASGGYVYRVKVGFVRIVSYGKDGSAVLLRCLQSGDYFGEEALTSGVRDYCALAATNTIVEEIPLSEMDEEDLAVLSASLLRAVVQSYQSIQDITSLNLPNRLAKVLLRLSKTPLAGRDKRGKAVIRITHDELASMVGSAREGTTKIIGQLSRRGYIKPAYGRIYILDRSGLESLAQQ